MRFSNRKVRQLAKEAGARGQDTWRLERSSCGKSMLPACTEGFALRRVRKVVDPSFTGRRCLADHGH